MATFEIMEKFGSSIVNLGVPLIMVLFLGVIGVIAYSSGILTRYPYKCILRLPRAGGAYKIVTVPGRSLPKGKGFEMKFGWWDKLVVSEPREEYTQQGDYLEGIMHSKEEVTWVKGVEIDATDIKFRAAVPENAQLTFAVAYDSAFQRTHKMKAWMQFAPHISLIIAAVILFGGMYVLGNMMKEASAANADAINRVLQNATVVVYKTASTTGDYSGFPNQPTANPNLPPG